MTTNDWFFLMWIIGITAVGALLVWQLVASILGGRRARSVALALLISPVQLSLVAAFGENRDVTDFLDLGVMPLSLVIGDVIVIPTACWIAANAYRKQRLALNAAASPGKWAHSWQWKLFCAAFGVASGLAFHAWDSANYVAMGMADLITSITKLLHDLMIWPALMMALLYTCIPLLVHRGWRGVQYGLIGCLVAWMTLVGLDGGRSLDAREFHTPCSYACATENIAEHLRLGDLVHSIPDSWHLK